MNEGDCFILDLGTVLYCWKVKDANKKEIRMANDFMRKLRDYERGGRGDLKNIGKCT